MNPSLSLVEKYFESKNLGSQIIKVEEYPWCFEKPNGFVETDNQKEISDPIKIKDELMKQLNKFRDLSTENPQINPSLSLANKVIEWLDNDKISYFELEAVQRILELRAFYKKTARMKKYMNYQDPEIIKEKFERIFTNWAFEKETEDAKKEKKTKDTPEDKVSLPFENFKQKMEQTVVGIVFTAHPTFSRSKRLVDIQTRMITGRNEKGEKMAEEEFQELFEEVLKTPISPEENLTQDREHEISLEVIDSTKKALTEVCRVALSVTKKFYSKNWKEVTPVIATIASWVKRDEDGKRKQDNPSEKTFEALYKEKRIQLSNYQKAIIAIIEKKPINDKVCKDIERTVGLEMRDIKGELKLFQEKGKDGLIEFENDNWEKFKDRLTGKSQLIALVNEAISSEENDEIVMDLLLLRAAISNMGLVASQTHFRLNSIKFINSMMVESKIVSEKEERNLKTSEKGNNADIKKLNRLQKLLDKGEEEGEIPLTVDFKRIFQTDPTAIEKFAFVSQMKEYIDSSTPIRFLIAEAGSSFPLLSALYFARLFGVDDVVDISPLIEKPEDIAKGLQTIKGTLDNKYFKEYIRKRGYFCVEIGFSDSGRYEGQLAAGNAIEDLQLGIRQKLDEANLHDVKVVIYNTHGESIGRGNHPCSFENRQDYILSPKAREAVDVPEESFQGVEGWELFATPEMALNTIYRLVSKLTEPASAEELGDPFYENKYRSFIEEFFNIAKDAQEKMVTSKKYLSFLNLYGSNHTKKKGSRAKMNADKGASGDSYIKSPDKIRAIENNDIFIQMGALINVFLGFGEAMRNDKKTFDSLYQASPRFKLFIQALNYALKITSIDTLYMHVNARDPKTYRDRAAVEKSPDQKRILMKTAEDLEATGEYTEAKQFIAEVKHDWLRFGKEIEKLCATDLKPCCAVTQETKDELEMSHSISVACQMKMYELVSQVVDFEPCDGVSRASIITAVHKLDIPSAVKDLENVYPVSKKDDTTMESTKLATFNSNDNYNYKEWHKKIFEPVLNFHALIQNCSTTIGQLIGSTG